MLITLTKAQNLPAITFHGQLTSEQAVSLEPYSVFYLDPSGDTLQPISHIIRQPFKGPEKIAQIYNNSNRIGMQQTSQIFWQQFQVANTHPTDTLRLRFAGGIHAVYSVYEKKEDSFTHIGSNGLCVPNAPKISGYGTVSIVVPPQVLPKVTCLGCIQDTFAK